MLEFKMGISSMVFRLEQSNLVFSSTRLSKDKFVRFISNRIDPDKSLPFIKELEKFYFSKKDSEKSARIRLVI